MESNNPTGILTMQKDGSMSYQALPRPVLFRAWIPPKRKEGATGQSYAGDTEPGTGCWGDFTEPATFHGWGLSTEVEQYQDRNDYTMHERVLYQVAAIVEKEDGTVELMTIDRIKFIKPQPHGK